MSMLDDYRRFQAAQAAKGKDPSSGARLTQQEQADYRQEQGLTPITPIVSATNNTGIVTQAQNNPTPAQAAPAQAAPAQSNTSSSNVASTTVAPKGRAAQNPDRPTDRFDIPILTDAEKQSFYDQYPQLFDKNVAGASKYNMANSALGLGEYGIFNVDDRKEFVRLNFPDLVPLEGLSKPITIYELTGEAMPDGYKTTSMFNDPGGYEGTIQETLDTSSQFYADNNPGAQNFQEYLEEKTTQTDNNQNQVDEEQEDTSGPSVYDSEEYQELLNRFDELEKQIAALSTDKETNTSTVTRRRNSGGGLVNSIINEGSVLINQDRSSIGGQVYGPDGSVYPSVTAAIQAGVFNYTYFPISTGVRQENKPITRRTVGAPVETAPNAYTNFLNMGNQSG